MRVTCDAGHDGQGAIVFDGHAASQLGAHRAVDHLRVHAVAVHVLESRLRLTGTKPWSCAAMKPVSLRPLGETRRPSQNHHGPSGVSSTCGPRWRHSFGKADDQTSGGMAWMSR